MAMMGLSTPTKDRSWTETGGMSSPSPSTRDFDAGEASGLCTPGHDDELMCHEPMWNDLTGRQHHVAALAGAREPLHRRGTVHEFLRGRELVRHARNTQRRPGISDFVHDARRPGCGIIPIVPPHTGVGSPPFVARFGRCERGQRLLAIADEEGVVTIVDAAGKLPGLEIDPEFRPEQQWIAHENAIFDAAWCHGDGRLLTASGDQSVRLWDVETAVPFRYFRRHNGSVKSISVRPDGGGGNGDGGNVFASCGRDGTIAMWDMRDSRRTRASASGIAPGPDGEPASVPAAVVERAHEPPAAMGGGVARGFGGRGERRAVTRSQTNELLDVTVEEFPARVRQRQQRLTTSIRNESRSVRGEIQHSVTSIAFAHDGQVLVSAGAADGLIKLWDVRQLSRGSPLWEIADEDPPELAGGKNWFRGDDESGASAKRRRRGRGVIALAMAPWGSSHIAASYSDSHIAVFDLHGPDSGPRCHLRGHRATSFYNKLAFSPEGTHVTSGSCDNHVYVWEVDRPLDPPAVLKGHTGEVVAVDWCPNDFTCLASCADDDTARVWRVDRSTLHEAAGDGEVRGVVGASTERGSMHTSIADRDFFRTPAPATRDRTPSTRGLLSGGEWLQRAVEEGRRLDFATPMPIFNARPAPPGVDTTCGDAAMNKENVDVNAGAAVALLTPGPVAARTRRGARRPLLAASQRNSILTYFTPRRGEDRGEDFMEVDGDDDAY
jgi:denticleless